MASTHRTRSHSLLVGVVGLVFACSQGASETPSSPTNADGGVTPEEAGAATVDFTFRVTGMRAYFQLMGESEIEAMLAVAETESGKRVFWKASTIRSSVDVVEFSAPGLLQKGVSYSLGAAVGGYGYLEIPPVTDRVVVEMTQEEYRTKLGNEYKRAYDLLTTPLKLKPGTYEGRVAATGTQIQYVVGSEGYLSPVHLIYGCTGSTSTCGGPAGQSIEPCSRSLVRGDTEQAHIGTSVSSGLSLVGDIRADTDKLVFTGKVAKTNCCSEALNLDLVRISNSTQGCK